MQYNTLKYKIISDDIRTKIITGYYKINQQLPLEKELGSLYSASRITVKKAMDLLVSDGLIIKRRGVGSFVKSAASFTENIPLKTRSMGFSAAHQNENVSTHLLQFSVVHPSEKTIKNLYLDDCDFVHHFTRVRYIDKKPYCIEYTDIPIKLIPGIRIDHLIDSIYRYIEIETDVSIQSQHQILRACCANSLEAKHLDIACGDPLMEIEQVSYLDNGRPFEYSIIRYRYDRFEFHHININK
ncbi:GntR family transcriptional regulator [Kluyvera sp. STS39-E]|uniref:GntR family transcriptional regulator n=1 Tax=Kluyvera sp. STS39-E TaxID=3234748 RepID=UPI0034C6899B